MGISTEARLTDPPRLIPTSVFGRATSGGRNAPLHCRAVVVTCMRRDLSVPGVVNGTTWCTGILRVVDLVDTVPSAKLDVKWSWGRG